MKNNALKTAGLVFIVVAASHGLRALMKLQMVVGTAQIPVWISAIAAVVLLALAVWMFKAASK